MMFTRPTKFLNYFQFSSTSESRLSQEWAAQKLKISYSRIIYKLRNLFRGGELPTAIFSFASTVDIITSGQTHMESSFMR